MITTNLCVQPPIALIQNADYNGFLADLQSLNSMSPMSQSPLGGGWTAQATLQRINGLYTQGFVMLFPRSWNITRYRGPIRLGFGCCCEC